jgi:hypothetical protein
MKKATGLLTSIFVFILLLLLTLPATLASAATYYVDATRGNDSTAQPGDINYPYKTINKINSLSLRPGDNVQFKRGERWREQLNCSWSGSAANPITFTAYGTGNKPIIHGGTKVTGWSGPDGNGVYAFPYTYGMNGILEDDLSLKRASDGTCVDGNWYYDKVTIYYKPTSATPGSHTVDRLSRGAGMNFLTQNNSYITIDNLHFIGLGIYGTAAIGSLSNIIVQNCDFTDAFCAVMLFSRNGNNNGPLTIQDCILNRCGINIFLESFNNNLETTSATIQRNTIINAWMTTGGGNWNWANTDRDGISLQNMTNSLIQHNEISGLCDASAGICHWIAKGVVSTGNVFMYNYIHDITACGIIQGGDDVGTASCIIAYNIIKNFGSGPGVNGIAGAPYGGIRLNRPQISSIPSGVFNNTIINGDISIYLNARTDYYIIKNNISYNPAKYHVLSNVPIEHNILDHNDYYSGITASFASTYSDGNYDFAGWRAYNGQESNSINEDPQFVDPDSNFQLQGTSPCIGTGAYGGFTQDFLGTPLPAVGVDIGACQLPAIPPPAFSPPCTYSISPTGQSFSSSGGTGTIQVTSVTNCSWISTANSSWIAITAGTGGIGNGQLKFTVAPNPTTTNRSGVITVAGQQFLVSQTGSTLLSRRTKNTK